MLVIDVPRTGGPEVLTAYDRPVPVPGAGEVLIKVKAAGVNRPDLMQRAGIYPMPPGAPTVPGLEVAGTVADVGPGVTRVKVGDAVCALLIGGGYAEYCVAPQAQCMTMPEGLSAVEAASLPEAAFTAWSALIERGHLKPDEWLLVRGGTTGVGSLAIQWARHLGARVITTAGSDEKCRYAVSLGCSLDPENIVITGGCMDSIALCLRAVTQPGDVVTLESPTHFSFLEVLQGLHLRSLEIPTHPRHGLSLDALQLALDTQPVKALLVVPTLSNPLGACMPQPERRRLAQMAARHGFAVIEDAIYNDLAEHDEMRRSVKSYDTTGHVMLCDSFSKTLAPGLRLGWVEAGRWTQAVHAIKELQAGGQSAVLELALADLITQTGHAAAMRQLRAGIAARMDEARRVIASHFPPGTRVSDPPGGLLMWLELPKGLDSVLLHEACLDQKILIAPGTVFSTSGRFRNCLRIGVGGDWSPAHLQALRTVGDMATRMLNSQREAA